MLIEQNLIELDLKAKNRDEAIEELSNMAFKAEKISSVEEFMNSVLEREKSYTTGVGNGIAIPHGKCDAVKEVTVVFGRSNCGIEWDSLDGKPVYLVFLLGIPAENAENTHLKILSQLSRKLMDENFVQTLKAASSKDEILYVLNEISK